MGWRGLKQLPRTPHSAGHVGALGGDGLRTLRGRDAQRKKLMGYHLQSNCAPSRGSAGEGAGGRAGPRLPVPRFPGANRHMGEPWPLEQQNEKTHTRQRAWQTLLNGFQLIN